MQCSSLKKTGMQRNTLSSFRTGYAGIHQRGNGARSLGMFKGAWLVTWKIVFTKQAQQDAKKLANAGLKLKAQNLLDVIRKDPFQNPLLTKNIFENRTEDTFSGCHNDWIKAFLPACNRYSDFFCEIFFVHFTCKIEYFLQFLFNMFFLVGCLAEGGLGCFFARFLLTKENVRKMLDGWIIFLPQTNKNEIKGK